MYGPCDLGLGYPELGYVRLNELQRMTVRVPPAGSVGIDLEQDLYFKPSHSLSTYAESARQNGAITDNPRLLGRRPVPSLTSRSSVLLKSGKRRSYMASSYPSNRTTSGTQPRLDCVGRCSHSHFTHEHSWPDGKSGQHLALPALGGGRPNRRQKGTPRERRCQSLCPAPRTITPDNDLWLAYRRDTFDAGLAAGPATAAASGDHSQDTAHTRSRNRLASRTGIACVPERRRPARSLL